MKKAALVFSFLCLISLRSPAQADSARKWRKSIDIYGSQIFLKSVMPYFKNVYSFSVGSFFNLSRSLKKYSNIKFNISVGAAYTHFHLNVPQLNVLYTSQNLPNNSVHPLDLVEYKNIDLRYFEIPIILSWRFRVNKKIGFGIGTGLSYYINPSFFKLNESYHLYTQLPSKTPYPSYGYQIHNIEYIRQDVIPFTIIDLPYKIGPRSELTLRFSGSVITQAHLLFSKDNGSSYDNRFYYFGYDGSSSVKLYALPYRNTRISVNYRYNF